MADRLITEKQFEAQVKDLAKIYQWKYYHTWRSIHSPVGFPDIVMVRPPRLIFAELKSEKGELTPEQEEWLELLDKCRQQIGAIWEPAQPEVYLWRPSGFEKIVEVLK